MTFRVKTPVLQQTGPGMQKPATSSLRAGLAKGFPPSESLCTSSPGTAGHFCTVARLFEFELQAVKYIFKGEERAKTLPAPYQSLPGKQPQWLGVQRGAKLRSSPGEELVRDQGFSGPRPMRLLQQAPLASWNACLPPQTPSASSLSLSPQQQGSIHLSLIGLVTPQAQRK